MGEPEEPMDVVVCGRLLGTARDYTTDEWSAWFGGFISAPGVPIEFGDLYIDFRTGKVDVDEDDHGDLVSILAGLPVIREGS